uniref:Lysosomal Pro-X carboxypeptidase n=1 Tax=Timema cristinae TaxID=61476 RepID=A0A7R9CN85_TIMCR|nr:unnamed protein product [Timema cristinae]
MLCKKNGFVLSAVVILFLGVPFCHGYKFKIKHITVPVDHFSFANNNTFQLKYLINDTYWKQDGGPIFFYTGNEGAIEVFAENTGFMWDNAADFGALIVFAEHRYYGESLPFGNNSFTSPKYSGYLTSSQALSDYVDLITHLKSQLKGAQTSPVIAFGGSYGGMLSAWLRIKYPHIVAGSIAASAPIWQFIGLTPCGAFNRIVTSDFQNQTPECSNTIRKSWDFINTITSTDAGKQWLSSNWKLCKPLKTTIDIHQLKDWLSDVYINLAMVDYPYPANFLEPLPANPVKVVCGYLTNSRESDKDLLKRLYKGLNVFFNFTGQVNCLDINQSSTSQLNDQGWDYQACTEMVMPMCSDGNNDMFEPQPWNFSEYSNTCYKKWKVLPQQDLIVKLYGGKDISTASNIVFSNGLLDPWSSGGVLRSLSKTVVSVIIPDGAHHLDLRASNPDDPVDVVIARNFHRKNIRTWINKHNKSNREER